MNRKITKFTVPILIVLLAVSFISSWTLYKKTETMHYAADEAIGYGLKSLSHELQCTLQELKELKGYGALDTEKFSCICERLDKSVFYSVETIASFDYGISPGYNDYDLFWFYCYISDVNRVSQNFDKLSTYAIQTVYLSLSKVCETFNQMNWNLPKTDNYFGISLKAYDFKKDPSGVRKHLDELETLTVQEQEKLQAYLQLGTGDNASDNGPEYAQEEIAAAIDVITDEFDMKWQGCTLTELYYAGSGISGQHQDWAGRNNADDVIVLLSSFEVGPNADPSLKPNSTYDNWMWILVRTDGGEWTHVDHGYYVPIL